MDANEFVKVFGLDIAKIAINECPPEYGLDIIELKRLVESNELVVQFGGLEGARSHLESIRFNIATKTWFGQALLNWSMCTDKLEKAIADVESCNENPN